MPNGDIPSSFAKALFHGKIEEDFIFPFPSMEKEEKSNIDLMVESINKFCQENVDPGQIDRDHKIPEKVITGLGELGMFGLLVPEEYGGFGLSVMGYCRCMQEIAKYDASIATMLMAHQSIGLKCIVMFGTEVQKRKYLPDLAKGKKIAGFALTEPTAGSDAHSIKTTAEKKDSHWILNGQKIWTTNGGIGHVYSVFAKTKVKIKGKEEDRITAFIVEKGMEGFESGPEEEKMGIRGSSTTSLFFNNVKVPHENVLGEVGRGFKYAMQVLNTGRLGLAAGSVGGCIKLIDLCIEEAQRRKQFNRSIISFGMIKEKIGHLILDAYALESVTYLTAGLIDKDVPDYSLESAICKILGSEGIWKTIDETIQIHGGNGYMTDLPLPRVMRDARIFKIFEGTNEILHLFIALAGMQSPGERLKEVSKAMRDPIKSLGLLSEFALEWVKKRSIGGAVITKAHPSLKREATLAEDHTLALSKTAESLLLRHGKDIIEKQFAQHRIANWTINLFIMFACISRATKILNEDGEEKSKKDLLITKAVCARCSRKIKNLMKTMDHNFDEEIKEIVSISADSGAYPVTLKL